MPSKELIEKVALAINGPFHPVPEGSLFTLDQLRDICWQQINGAERNLCLAGAEAAISTILAALQDPTERMRRAAYTFQDDLAIRDGDVPTFDDYWRIGLAASALGEQSE